MFIVKFIQENYHSGYVTSCFFVILFLGPERWINVYTADCWTISPFLMPIATDIITRRGEGGIPCGDHVNCFVYGYFMSPKDEWNITTQNNEHDLHRGSPTHLFLFLCRTIDVISSSGIVPVLCDLYQRSRYGDRVQNRP